MGRKKKSKTIQEEVREGLRRLAFGEIHDAVRLLFAEDNEILNELENLNLYNVSEIKRPRGGGMEIKFFDRLKALERLRDTENDAPAQPLSFYRALEEGARSAAESFGADSNE